MSKTQKLMQFSPDAFSEDDGQVMFEQVSEEDEEYATCVISRLDWIDLGRPDTITLTVEPGDRLNTEVIAPKGPHAKTCKTMPHTHGKACSVLCPTCGGMNLVVLNA